MKNRRSLLLVLLVLSMALPVGLGAADKRQRVDSSWREKDVVVDGDYGEWKGPLVAVGASDPITAAAVNDGQFLYVVLSTSEPALRMQILRQGLIVWFDPGGGTKKHFGLKYPVGIIPGDGAERVRGGRRPDLGNGQTGEARDAEQADTRLEPTNRLEVFGPEKDDAHSFVADMAPGIAVKVGQVQGSLVYELKVPIGKTAEFPYAIEAKPGALIGFGLETPKFERPSEGRGGAGGGMGGMGGGGRGRGGMGGGGRGGGGRGGGRGPGGERVAAPKPLKAWATIQLAAH